MGSDVEEKVGGTTCSNEELYVVPLYPWFSAHISYSLGALPLEEVADADDAKMKRRDSEEGNSGEDDCRADEVADNLSVMYPPCQDPLLVKIYRGLPTLPCVAVFFLCNVYKRSEFCCFKSPL